VKGVGGFRSGYDTARLGVNSLPVSAHADASLPLRKSDLAQWESSDFVPMPQQYLPGPAHTSNSSFRHQPLASQQQPMTQSSASFQGTPTAIGPLIMSNGAPNPLHLNHTTITASSRDCIRPIAMFFPEEKRKKLTLLFEMIP
jgi:hypothetical protein